MVPQRELSSFADTFYHNSDLRENVDELSSRINLEQLTSVSSSLNERKIEGTLTTHNLQSTLNEVGINTEILKGNGFEFDTNDMFLGNHFMVNDNHGSDIIKMFVQLFQQIMSKFQTLN